MEWTISGTKGKVYHVTRKGEAFACDHQKVCWGGPIVFDCKHITEVRKQVKVEAPKQESLLPYAEQYVKWGWSVIPVAYMSKQPLIKWTPFQYSKASLDLVRSWWHRWPNANIGIVTGKISGIVVVDLDAKAKDSLEELGRQGRFLSVTRAHDTASGQHWIYKHPGGELRNTTNLYPGIDIRGDGGYIVAPPSTHASGVKYMVRHDTYIADMPKWLLEEALARQEAP